MTDIKRLSDTELVRRIDAIEERQARADTMEAVLTDYHLLQPLYAELFTRPAYH